MRNISVNCKSSCCHKIDCQWHLLSPTPQFDYSIKACLPISPRKRRKCGQNYILPANWVIRDRDHNGKLGERSLCPQSMFNELCNSLKLYIRYCLYKFLEDSCRCFWFLSPSSILFSGLPRSMPNADQNPGIDPKYLSMPTIANQCQLIGNDRYWSWDQCHNFNRHWWTLIGIGQWSRESPICVSVQGVLYFGEVKLSATKYTKKNVTLYQLDISMSYCCDSWQLFL